MTSWLVIIILVFLVVLNGLFAMAETALVSSRKARLKQRAREGSHMARAALRLVRKPTRFLATTQIGITIIGILSGAVAQDKLSHALEVWLHHFPQLARFSGTISTAILVLCLTYFSLLIGELLPKRIALMYPETIAATVAMPMGWLSMVASPLVKILNVSTDALLKLMAIRPPRESPVTPEELKVLIQEGTNAGVFEKTEQDIVSNVFRLADRRAGALMTPRKDIAWLDTNEDEEAIKAALMEHNHGFFPVGQGSLDNIVGVVSTKEILSRVLSGEPIQVYQMLHKPLIVPESISVLQLLDAFRQNPAQIAMVADEYGSILGLVSQDDVLEAVVGDLSAATGTQYQPDIQVRADGAYVISGAAPADELRERLSVEELPNENQYDTVAGFVMLQLQKIPIVGDRFEWLGYLFEVTEMDGKRVDEVVVSQRVKIDEDEPAAQG